MRSEGRRSRFHLGLQTVIPVLFDLAAPKRDRLARHQRHDMGCDRSRQALEIVSAFKDGDQVTVTMSIGNVHQRARCPRKVGFDQIKAPKRVAHVRIETCGNDDQLRREVIEARQ